MRGGGAGSEGWGGEDVGEGIEEGQGGITTWMRCLRVLARVSELGCLGSGSGGFVRSLLSPLGLCKMRVLLRDRHIVMN